jgi:uncharacterized protein (DUF1697 family)/tetratricopeptide (TPR) repeat protein
VKRYVAFLRAINVGGHVVKMDALRRIFEGTSLANVKTFINSGNVLFDSATTNPKALEEKLARELRKALGFEVAVFIRSASEVTAISEHAPFAPAELKDGSLFVGMLAEPPGASDRKTITSLETPVDKLRVHRREVYWYAAKHFREALFSPARMEKLLGRPATFRNISTIRRIAMLVAKPCLVLMLMVPQQPIPQLPALPPNGIISYRAALIRDWSNAAMQHTPGEDDEALSVVRRWSADELREAWIGVNVLLALLANPTLKVFSAPQWGRQIPIVVARHDVVMLAGRAEELRRTPGHAAFLKRAAVLHSDLALEFGSDPPPPPFNMSFLIPLRTFVKTSDGTQDSLYTGDVNWEFARILLDNVPDVKQDADVRQWYRASLSHMLLVEHLDNPHFGHALKLFADAAEVLFLNGCLHESLANPRVQRVVEEIQLPPGTTLDVGSESYELRQAESLFRRALDVNPAHVEARLRHGRTLARLGRHTDAASELRRALDAASETLLEYYAALFLGAELEALNQFAEARTAYQRAAKLSPDARAPRLALSQLTHRSGDRAAARAELDSVLQPYQTDLEHDPWWTYQLTCGRGANDLMAEVYRSVGGPSR